MLGESESPTVADAEGSARDGQAGHGTAARRRRRSQGTAMMMDGVTGQARRGEGTSQESGHGGSHGSFSSTPRGRAEALLSLNNKYRTFPATKVLADIFLVWPITRRAHWERIGRRWPAVVAASRSRSRSHSPSPRPAPPHRSQRT